MHAVHFGAQNGCSTKKNALQCKLRALSGLDCCTSLCLVPFLRPGETPLPEKAKSMLRSSDTRWDSAFCEAEYHLERFDLLISHYEEV